MIFQWVDKAHKDNKALPKPIQEKANKLFRLFEENPRHPSIHVEKIDFVRNVWSARIDQNYRMTFQWITGGILIRRLANNDSAYRKP